MTDKTVLQGKASDVVSWVTQAQEVVLGVNHQILNPVSQSIGNSANNVVTLTFPKVTGNFGSSGRSIFLKSEGPYILSRSAPTGIKIHAMIGEADSPSETHITHFQTKIK